MYQLLLHMPSFVMHAIISQSIMHDLEIHKALRTEKAFTMYSGTKPNQTWTHVVEKPDLIWYNPIYNVYLISRNIHTLDFKIMNVSHYRMPPPNSQGCSKIYCLQPESQRGEEGRVVRAPPWAQNSHCSHVTAGDYSWITQLQSTKSVGWPNAKPPHATAPLLQGHLDDARDRCLAGPCSWSFHHQWTISNDLSSGQFQQWEVWQTQSCGKKMSNRKQQRWVKRRK